MPHIPSSALAVAVQSFQVSIIRKSEFKHSPYSTRKTHKEPKWQSYGKVVFSLLGS